MAKTATKPAPAPIPAASAPMIKGAYGTMYFVKDMKKTVSWFKEKLGVNPGFEDPNWTEFPLSGHSLCLHLADPKKAHPANGTLILHVADIKKLVAELKAKGAKVVGEIHEVHPGAWAADLTDPDGNALSLYEGPKSA